MHCERECESVKLPQHAVWLWIEWSKVYFEGQLGLSEIALLKALKGWCDTIRHICLSLSAW